MTGPVPLNPEPWIPWMSRLKSMLSSSLPSRVDPVVGRRFTSVAFAVWQPTHASMLLVRLLPWSDRLPWHPLHLSMLTTWRRAVVAVPVIAKVLVAVFTGMAVAGVTEVSAGWPSRTTSPTPTAEAGIATGGGTVEGPGAGPPTLFARAALGAGWAGVVSLT